MPRIGRGKSHPRLASAIMGEQGHEQAFAGQKALSGPGQPAQKARLLMLSGTIAKDRIHVDIGMFEHQRPGLGNGTFAGVQFDLDKLHFRAPDLEINIIIDPGRTRMPRGGYFWHRTPDIHPHPLP